MTDLKFVLEGQGIETSRARTCAEAEQLFAMTDDIAERAR
jgi:hypothetical protein